MRSHRFVHFFFHSILDSNPTQIIPNIVNAQETNFRQMRESHSLDLDRQMLTNQNLMTPSSMPATPGWNDGINSPSGSGEWPGGSAGGGTAPGTPLPGSPSMGRRNSPAGLASPLPKEDAFGAFNSVTILHS
jgi:protein-serine/threonine kinase